VTLTLRYGERLTPGLGAGGTATYRLRPKEQLIIPEGIAFLRQLGMAIGALGEAIVYGLRADATSRSNVAVIHAGQDGSGSIGLDLPVLSGDPGGAAIGSPIAVTLAPGQWEQVSGILGAVNVRNGWVRIRRTSGSAPWIAYGVVNDGGSPGERTGDGAYVPMALP